MSNLIKCQPADCDVATNSEIFMSYVKNRYAEMKRDENNVIISELNTNKVIIVSVFEYKYV